jgi:hypothetical protein
MSLKSASFASKVSNPRRSPNISIRAQKSPSGVVILIQMPPKEAQAVAELANRTARAKSSANAGVLKALRAIREPETRVRLGLIQGNIPGELKSELIALAKGRDSDAAALLRDRLHSWIDPQTGRRRRYTKDDRSIGVRGPSNYRRYVSSFGDEYAKAKKSKSLKRYQIEVGENVAMRICNLLKNANISHGEFLTALAADVCQKMREKVSIDATTTSASANTPFGEPVVRGATNS